MIHAQETSCTSALKTVCMQNAPTITVGEARAAEVLYRRRSFWNASGLKQARVQPWQCDMRANHLIRSLCKNSCRGLYDLKTQHHTSNEHLVITGSERHLRIRNLCGLCEIIGPPKMWNFWKNRSIYEVIACNSMIMLYIYRPISIYNTPLIICQYARFELNISDSCSKTWPIAKALAVSTSQETVWQLLRSWDWRKSTGIWGWKKSVPSSGILLFLFPQPRSGSIVPEWTRKRYCISWKNSKMDKWQTASSKVYQLLYP